MYFSKHSEIKRYVTGITIYDSSIDVNQLIDVQNALLLDLFLAPHVDALFHQTRTHGMIEYFRCYSSVSLAEMTEEFCWDSVEDLQEELIKLILSDRLAGRIDSVNQVLNRVSEDVLVETALKVQRDLDNLRRNMRFALIRTNMARNAHYVRVSTPCSIFGWFWIGFVVRILLELI